MKFLKPNIITAFILFLAGSACFNAKAAGFIDMRAPDRFIVAGARVGMNISTLTFSPDYFNLENTANWDKGALIGAVADIYIRNFVSLQPGFFFDIRKSGYSVGSSHYIPHLNAEERFEYREIYQWGDITTCNLLFPSLIRFHFNPGKNVTWNPAVGPYYNIRLSMSGAPKAYHTHVEETGGYYFKESNGPWNRAELGIMAGMGFTFFRHYSISAYYLVGLRNAWSMKGWGGRNKAWTFMIGYNF